MKVRQRQYPQRQTTDLLTTTPFRTTARSLSNDDIVVAGYFRDEVIFNTDFPESIEVTDDKAMADPEMAFDLFLTRMTKDGKYLWTKVISTPGLDRAGAIAADAQDNIYVAGITRERLRWPTSIRKTRGHL